MCGVWGWECVKEVCEVRDKDGINDKQKREIVKY